MVMMFVGGVVLMLDKTFRTIPTVEKLRGGSFSFPPEPIAVKLLKCPLLVPCTILVPFSYHLKKYAHVYLRTHD